MNIKLMSKLFFPLGFLCIFGAKLLHIAMKIEVPKNINITLNIIGLIFIILSLVFNKKETNKE